MNAPPKGAYRCFGAVVGLAGGGPPMPDTSKVITQSKRCTLVFQVINISLLIHCGL